MSRLECKVIEGKLKYKGQEIRICPDWNVKIGHICHVKAADGIRICPDWNVKKPESWSYLLEELIRICPDWNVKLSTICITILRPSN